MTNSFIMTLDICLDNLNRGSFGLSMLRRTEFKQCVENVVKIGGERQIDRQ